MKPKTSILVLFILVVLPSSNQAKEGNRGEKEILIELQRQVLELRLEISEIKENHAMELREIKQKLELLLEGDSFRAERLDPEKVASHADAERPDPPRAGSTPAPQDYYSQARSQDRSFQTFNPDIAVIADFYSGYVKQGEEEAGDVLVREIELGFSGAVDTYGRYDLILSLQQHPNLETGGGNRINELGQGNMEAGFLGEDAQEPASGELALEIEEGYFTFLTLPADLQLRVGKFRNRIGKTNPLHVHYLPWPDYPLVVQRFMGEEGLSGSGGSLSWLAPGDQYLEITYELFRLQGEEGSGLFDTDASGISHLLNANTFFELSDSTTLELGATSAITPGSDLIGGERSWVNGIDLTYKWRPMGTGTFRGFEWRTELFGLRRTLTLARNHDHNEETGLRFFDVTLMREDNQLDVEEGFQIRREGFFGLFTSLEYQFDKKWLLGFRFDYVEGPFDPGFSETAYSAYLTWWQSEYAYWRMGYLRGEPDSGAGNLDSENSFFLQFNLSLGPHPAHKY